jgi:hypothetical protein
MKAARWRLIAATVLFAAWLGYLIVLAVGAAHPVVQLWPFHVTKVAPVVLSRPQLLVSTLDVIADVQEADGEPSPEVTVVEIHWPKKPPVQPEEKIRVEGLPISSAEGWQGPGRYILPLVPKRDGRGYEVAPIPPSPGFRGNGHRIYPDTPDTREQLDAIPKPADAKNEE